MLAERRDYGAALACARRAVGLAPEHPDALKNLACILYRMERFGEARVCIEAANQRRPADPGITFNCGAISYALGDLAAAEEWYIQAAAAATNEVEHARALTQLAYPVLARGDYQRGLALYEHRFAEIARTQVWELGIPEWQGEDLAGKHILVHHDQGIGDDLQFARFLPDLADRAGMITLAVPSDLMLLMQVAARNRWRVVDIEGELPEADFHSAIASYPRRLGIDLPAWPRSYLAALRWDDRPLAKPPGTELAIGIVWAPRAIDERSERRRIPPGDLIEQLGSIAGVKLYSLQVGAEAAELRDGGIVVEDLSRQLRDWSDSAAYMAALDLIVSADSAPLHLAGALGRPCIGLLPYVPCWRWGFGADRTPWYPTMRLLRQSTPGDWSGPLQQLRHLVKNRIAAPDWELKEKVG